jgi:Tol biopolymer transport system component
MRLTSLLSALPLLLAAFTLSARQSVPAQVLASVPPPLSDGDAASGSSFSPLSRGSGRFVFFLSTAGNLSTNDLNGGILDLYRHDLQTDTTQLVSARASDGLAGNGPVTGFSASTDGRWVAFSSRASDLLPDDTNRSEDIFLRDMDTGAVRWVSRTAAGVAANGDCRIPIISGPGNHVLFESTASNLATGSDTNRTTDVFLWDRTSGESRRISSRTNGAAGSSLASSALLSDDGGTVVFRYAATDIVAAGNQIATDLLVWTRSTATLRRIQLSGSPPAGVTLPLTTYNTALSGDGRYLSFLVPNATTTVAAHEGIWRVNLNGGSPVRASGTLLVGNAAAITRTKGPVLALDGLLLAFTAQSNAATAERIFAWDAVRGVTTLNARRQTPTPGTEEPATAYAPLLSPDGALIAFETDAAVPAAGVPVSTGPRLYVRELSSGRTWTPAPNLLTGYSDLSPEFAPDSQSLFIAAPFPLPGVEDHNGSTDVYQVSPSFEDVRLVSQWAPGLANRTGDAPSRLEPNAFSDDGRFITFTSAASNLVEGDQNLRRDVFLRDLEEGVQVLVSVGLDGKPAQGDSRQPRISASGTRVAFVSTATNLIANDSNAIGAVYVRDLADGTTTLVSARDQATTKSTWSARNPVMSADGQWVLFESQASDLIPGVTTTTLKLFLRHLPTRRTILVSGTLSPASPADTFEGFGAQISGDGSRVAFVSRTTAYVYNVGTGLREPALPATPNNAAFSVSLSRDGQHLALLSVVPANPALKAVLWRDLSSTVVKAVATQPQLPTGIRFSNVFISGNGGFVAFDSNYVPGGMTDSNNTNDVFISDISTSSLTRISTPTGQSGPGNGYSDSPVLSHDGNRIVFRSAASNLTDVDTNGLPDIFVHDRLTGTTRLLSRHPVTGASANGASSRPRISANGRRIAFESMASDLVPDDYNQESDVFVTSVASATSLTFATLTPGPDGRLRWSLQGEPGAQVVLQSSTDLNAWTPLSTNLLPAEVEVNPATGGDLLLLRAVQGN